MSEWRKCTSCKGEIGFKVAYWICNVTTCQKKRAGLIFCSMDCWDAHLPILRHKDAWAIELRSPSEDEWKEVLAGDREDPTYPARERPKEEAPPPVEKRVSTAPTAILRRKRDE